MANITFLRCKALKELLQVRSTLSLSHFVCRNFSNSNSDDANENEFVDDESYESEEVARLQQLQDVSGLPPQYYQQYHGLIKEPPFNDLKTRRKMYVTYGSKSGEDSRLLWPSRQEIAELQKEDREEEVPLSVKLQLMKEERDEELKVKLERHKMIKKNMAQMNKWISEYYKKVETAEVEIQKRKEKKDALLDEAREYFGYRVKANDPKFQQMVEEKEEKERKEAKERKKKEKARKLSERMKQDVLAMKSGSHEESKSKEKP